MISGISQGSDNSVFSVLGSMQKEQKGSLNKATPDSSVISVLGSMQKEQKEEDSLASVVITLKKEQDQENPALATLRATQKGLSSDVYSAQEESKYISATKEAFNVQSQMELTSHKVIADTMKDVLATYGVDPSTSALSETIKAMKRNKKIMEESIRNLDEVKDGIKQKAKESALPKGESSQLIEGLPTESAGEATLMPEISGSNPAPAPVIKFSDAPTPDVAQVSSLTSGVTSSFSSLSQSIDISV